MHCIRVGHNKRDGKTAIAALPLPPRDMTIRLRLTSDERREWIRAAKLEGRSLSEMLRHVVNDHALEVGRRLGGD